MSMDEFVKTLTVEQKTALLKALNIGDHSQEPPSSDEKVHKQAEEDFAMHKNNNLQSNSRRVPVQAQANTWVDEGESRDITTPEVKRTPRTRKSPRKKTVKCHVCGKENKVNANLVYGEYYRCDRCTGR